MNLRLLRVIDEQFLETPFYGSRQMTRWLRRQGDTVSRKRVRRLMRRLRVHAVCQRPRTSQSHPGHRIYPYLLRDLQITQPNHVWCTDVTYIPLQRDFLYLVAVMDWASRTVLSWRLSNTLEANFCVEALHEALERYGPPAIFNSDQGSQFTSVEFTDVLKEAGIRISMDGKGRWMDNVFIERLWRSLKYECVYLAEFATGSQARTEIGWWMDCYNRRRPHSSLNDRTPEEAYTDHGANRSPGATPLESRTRDSTLAVTKTCPKDGVHLSSRLSMLPLRDCWSIALVDAASGLGSPANVFGRWRTGAERFATNGLPRRRDGLQKAYAAACCAFPWLSDGHAGSRRVRNQRLQHPGVLLVGLRKGLHILRLLQPLCSPVAIEPHDPGAAVEHVDGAGVGVPAVRSHVDHQHLGPADRGGVEIDVHLTILTVGDLVLDVDRHLVAGRDDQELPRKGQGRNEAILTGRVLPGERVELGVRHELRQLRRQRRRGRVLRASRFRREDVGEDQQRGNRSAQPSGLPHGVSLPQAGPRLRVSGGSAIVAPCFYHRRRMGVNGGCHRPRMDRSSSTG